MCCVDTTEGLLTGIEREEVGKSDKDYKKSRKSKNRDGECWRKC